MRCEVVQCVSLADFFGASGPYSVSRVLWPSLDDFARPLSDTEGLNVGADFVLWIR